MENRFKFGKNWISFLRGLNENSINHATESFNELTQDIQLEGKSFLDVGSGSGLSSLIAKNKGSSFVRSFDYDFQSVECTNKIKNRFYPDDKGWVISHGSVLDTQFLDSLGQFDFVYSWGVLHHTGKMHKALQNIDLNVKKGGFLFVAIYNDQGVKSKIWKFIKKIYSKVSLSRGVIILTGYFIFWMPHFFWGLLRLNPFRKWNNYKKNRGMSPHHDLVDWVGGYPFEVAKPREIIDFYSKIGYKLLNLKTCGSKLGCNEFVFKKIK